jgi:hypothetical protein
VAAARASKLILNSRTGKHNRENAKYFFKDLKGRLANRFQLTTDGWNQFAGYDGVVRGVFGESIDYATETKYYAKRPLFLSACRRFTPQRSLACESGSKLARLT